MLFDRTIQENISYGVEDQVTHDDIVQAAKLANIHQFVLTLPAVKYIGFGILYYFGIIF